LYEGIFGKSSLENDIALEKDHVFLDSDAVYDQYCYDKDCDDGLEAFVQSYFLEDGALYDYWENFGEEPGTEYKYSNMGTALIAVLVENISGMDFNEYCKLNIFTPLGLKNTYWRLGEISNTIVQPYDYENGEHDLIKHYTWPDYPNGGIRASASDVYKFFRAFTQNGSSNGYQLLKQETISEMLTKQVPALEESVGLHMFAYPEVGDSWGHDGKEMGTTAFSGFNKDSKLGVIVLNNAAGDHIFDIATAVFKAFSGR